MTLPYLETRLMYFLHYAQQGCQEWEDDLPLEAVRCMKKQEKGKSNLHAEEDFSEKLDTTTWTLFLVSSSRNAKRCLERCPHLCSAKNWSRWTSNSYLSFSGKTASIPRPTGPNRRDGTPHPDLYRCRPYRGV